jgi:hypothetical protein
VLFRTCLLLADHGEEMDTNLVTSGWFLECGGWNGYLLDLPISLLSFRLILPSPPPAYLIFVSAKDWTSIPCNSEVLSDA